MKSRYWIISTALIIILAMGLPAQAAKLDPLSKDGSRTSDFSFQNHYPPSGATDVDTYTSISVEVYDNSGTVDPNSIELKVDGSSVTFTVREYPTSGAVIYSVSYQPPTPLQEGTVHQAEITACGYGYCHTDYWSFMTASSSQNDLVITNLFPPDGEQNADDLTTISADVIDISAGVEPTSIVMSVNGAPVSPIITAMSSQPGYHVMFTPTTPFPVLSEIQVTLDACNTNGYCITEDWSFRVCQGTSTIWFDDFQPADGAINVPADTDVSLKAHYTGSGLDPATATMIVAGFRVTPQTITPINDGYAITYDPPNNFAVGMHVEVTFEMCNHQGDCQSESWEFDVGTGSALAFQNHVPAKDATDVPVDTSIEVDVIDRGFGVTSAAISMTLAGSDVTPTVTTIANGLHVAYDPPYDLSESSKYDVRVSVCDQGNCVDEDWSFMTNGPPVLTYREPAAGAMEAPADTPVIIEVVDYGSGVDRSSLSLKVNSSPVSTTIAPVTNGYRMSYQPASPFGEGSSVAVSLSACDMTGECMDTSWTFNVAAPPFATNYNPSPAAGDVAPDTNIYVEVVDVGVGVDLGTIQMEVDGATVSPTITNVSKGYGLTYEPLYSYSEGQSVSVGLSACDLENRCFNTTYSFTISSPPYARAFAPADGATNVPVDANIYAEVGDIGTGLDFSTMAMAVNGQQVSPVIDLIGNMDYSLTYDPPVDFGEGETVDVTLEICDYAGLCVNAAWSFETERTTPTPTAPTLVYPFDGAWLNYHLENGLVRFTWTAVAGIDSYRLMLSPVNMGIDIPVDLGPGDYSESFGMITALYPVDKDSWDVMAQLDGVNWKVAGLNYVGGTEITQYSDTWLMTFAPTDAVILRAPQDYAVLYSANTPIFKWDSYPGATSYLVGFARMAQDGSFIAQTKQELIPGWLNELPLTQGTWNTFDTGYWLWTVIAIDASGQRSGHMIYHFTKSRSATTKAAQAPFPMEMMTSPDKMFAEQLLQQLDSPELWQNYLLKLDRYLTN